LKISIRMSLHPICSKRLYLLAHDVQNGVCKLYNLIAQTAMCNERQ
jgi:hypothetical protein